MVVRAKHLHYVNLTLTVGNDFVLELPDEQARGAGA